MQIKPGADFENLETRCAEKHPFVFGSGPIIVHEDERRGLILAGNRHNYLLGFCTNAVRKSDNKSTNRPKNILFSNYATRELLRVDDELSIHHRDVASVYSSKQLINAAYPKWRHTSEEVKMHYHQQALTQLAEESGHNPYAFTMLLSPVFGKEVITQGGSSYLHERLTLKLKRALGRTPVMWLILEAVKTKSNHNIKVHGKGPVDQSNGLLHVHGSIALHLNEVPILRRVVRLMNGSSNSKFNNQELRVKLIKDDAYWVEYCNKHRFINLMFLNGMQRYSRSKLLAGRGEKIYLIDKGKVSKNC